MVLLLTNWRLTESVGLGEVDVVTKKQKEFMEKLVTISISANGEHYEMLLGNAAKQLAQQLGVPTTIEDCGGQTGVLIGVIRRRQNNRHEPQQSLTE